jgi:hypothetical protein
MAAYGASRSIGCVLMRRLTALQGPYSGQPGASPFPSEGSYLSSEINSVSPEARGRSAAKSSLASMRSRELDTTSRHKCLGSSNRRAANFSKRLGRWPDRLRSQPWFSKLA